jgi:serine/threonine protein kinase
MNSARPSEMSLASLPRAGDVIAGKYRVESIIGKGGMGVVLGAMDTSLGRPVAIKFLAPSNARNPDAAARFVREAQAAASLQSEHVVRVFEVGTLQLPNGANGANGASYIVMELLVGRDLGQLLATRGPLSFEEAADYVIEACEAIGEAHVKGIVHRDLKPQNLFLATLPDGSPSVKVLDFGISKAASEGAVSLTSTDTVMGTPLYMSPEQVRSLKHVDLRSDIWSLGAILFELLTGSPVFDATTASALCAMIAMDPPTPLRAKRADAPPELEAVIQRCLHKDPAGRFQNAFAFTEALAPFASQRGRLSSARVGRVVNAAGGLAYSATAYVNPSNAVTAGGPFQATAAPSVPGSMLSSQWGAQLPMPTDAPTASYPPGAMPALHTFGPLPGPLPYSPQRTTNDPWQHQTGAQGATASAPRRGGSAAILIAGGAAVVVVLLMASGTALFLLARSSASRSDDSGTTVATAAPPVSAAPTIVASVAPAVPVAPVIPGRRGGVAGKDAGAPGAPGAPGGATPPAATAPDDSAARRQLVQARCASEQFELSRNDATNNGARNAKNQACVFASNSLTSANTGACERANCRTACTILKDQGCLGLLDVAERSAPVKN